MRLAIVLFALSLASCQSQHVARPVFAPIAPVSHVTKILITTTVDDAVRLCVEVTPEMRIDFLLLTSEVCGFSVGELRKEFAHLSNAN